MIYDRRDVLRYTVTGTAALLLPSAFVRSAHAQKATLTAMEFASKRVDASTADYRKWFLDEHAVDILSFGKPYLSRFAQNFVERAHRGDVEFDAIIEFGYRSNEDRDMIFKLGRSPEAREIFAHHPEAGTKVRPRDASFRGGTYSVNERLVAGTPRHYDKPATIKQAALLRHKDAGSVAAVAEAAVEFTTAVARKVRDASERVTLDVAVPEENRPAPPYDAVVVLWPKGGANLADAFDGVPSSLELVNIVDLLGYESDLGLA